MQDDNLAEECISEIIFTANEILLQPGTRPRLGLRISGPLRFPEECSSQENFLGTTASSGRWLSSVAYAVNSVREEKAKSS